jgi:hypothetical protein
MTESEAKTKWCPMARPYGDIDDAHSFNRHSDGSPNQRSNCIGSDCMMWQTTNDRQGGEYKTIGYCGLVK